MLSAIGRISFGSDFGTPSTQRISSESVFVHTSAREMPRSLGARAASLSLVPPQSGQMSCLRNFSTRFMPDSSFTFASAFSTVYVALKYVKSSSPAEGEFLAW